MYCKVQYSSVPIVISQNQRVMATSRRPKIKTATLTVRLDPKVKVAAEAAAEYERRSLTSLLEVLILDHCRRLGLKVEQLKK